MLTRSFHCAPTRTLLTLCCGLLLQALPLVSRAETEPAGICFAMGSDHQRTIVPLKATEVLLGIQPGVMQAEVVQTFSSHTDSALEATYLFPLPVEATITHFELHYRDRVVTSVVRAKAEAQAVENSDASRCSSSAVFFPSAFDRS